MERLKRSVVQQMSTVLITMTTLEEMYPILEGDEMYQQVRSDLQAKMKAHLRATSQAAKEAAEKSERVQNARLGRLRTVVDGD